jgi:hypothetical protein
MVALAALNQRRRRAELTDAAVAATLAALGATLASYSAASGGAYRGTPPPNRTSRSPDAIV